MKRRVKSSRKSVTSQEKPPSSRERGAVAPAGPSHTAGSYFLFFLIFLSIFACYKLVQPYLNAIILATILAILAKPVYCRIVHAFGGRRGLAAFFACILLVLVVVLPLTFTTFALIQQGVQAFNGLSDWIVSGEYKTLFEHPWILKIDHSIQKYLPDIQRFFPHFSLADMQLDTLLLDVSAKVGKHLLNQGGQLFGNITSFAGQSFLMVFTFFFMVRDQEKIFDGILHLIPLSSSQEEQILDKVQSVSKSVIFGTFITALAQGIAGGIAFHIAGLPGLFWGTMMAFASLIPLVGTTLIWVPAAAFLLLSGHWGYSLFVLVWCALIVGSIDNVIRPLFMKGSGQNMSTLVIFFSLLGGINYFGLIGLLYGPLIVGLTMVLLYIYSLEFNTFLTQQDKK